MKNLKEIFEQIQNEKEFSISLLELVLSGKNYSLTNNPTAV